MVGPALAIRTMVGAGVPVLLTTKHLGYKDPALTRDKNRVSHKRHVSDGCQAAT